MTDENAWAATVANPTDSTSSQRLRPVTWPVWLAWVLVSGLDPAFSTISATAFNKQISPNAQHQTLITYGLLALIAFTVLAPPLMQGIVLKRVLPKLNVAVWFFCILLSAILRLLLMEGRFRQVALIEAGFRTQTQIEFAALTQNLAGTLTAAHILDLPWGPFLLWTIGTSALTSLVPAWALGRASGLRRATLLFLVASIVGALTSAIVEQIYMSFDVRPLHERALNGLSWTQRFQVLVGPSGVGAVWGATTAIFVVLMIRRFRDAGAPSAEFFAVARIGGLVLVLSAPLLIALLAPFAGYLAGPRGIVAGVPELREAISLAPAQDRSQGETILAYSHDIEVSIARIPQIVMSPYGQTAIVRTVDQALLQVDLATGHVVRQLAGALTPLERHVIVWSPNGRYLALRSDGTEVPIPNTNHTRHRSRIRLYKLPELTLVEEYWNNEDNCFDSYAREPILFSSDSNSLWLVCGQPYAPKPTDPMAIRLRMPTMQVLDVQHYGESAESGEIRGLDQIGDDVWGWQFPYQGKPFRVRDLTHGREILTVPMPQELIGDMTAQTDQSQVTEKTIRLSFCGAPPGASDAGPASWICRTLTFDTRVGALIGSVDKDDFRIPSSAVGSPNSTLSGRGLRIESYWRNDSKTGKLVVRDDTTGAERQRIISVAQRPLRMSADGAWLMTTAIYGGGLRLYRIRL